MTLHRYFALKYLRAFLALLAAFMLLATMIELVEQYRRFDAGQVGFANALGLALLQMPKNIYDILPIIALLASIALYLGFARTSELVVTRAAGRSALRATSAPALIGFGLGLLAIGAVNPIIAATSKRYETLSMRYEQGVDRVFSVSGDGLWLRQSSLIGQTVIHAARASLDGTVFFDVVFFGFDEYGRPVYRIEADRAALEDGSWQIGSGKRWPLGNAVQNPESDARLFDSFVLPSNLSPDQIRDSFGDPTAVPIWDLPGFVDRLQAAGFAATAHRLFFQMELAKPLLLAAMVLIGAGYLMRPARFGRTGIMVLAAVLTGAGLYFLRNFAQVMGETGDIPVWVAAWTPPVAGMLMAVWLMLQFEDA